MKVVCVWKDNTDYAREVTDWMEEFRRETGNEVESLDPDTVNGEIFVRAHDIMEYPTIVAIAEDGKVQREWRGTPMPQFDEVSYYLRQM